MTERKRRVRPASEGIADDQQQHSTDAEQEEKARDGETDMQAIDRVIQGYTDKIRSPSTAIRAFCVTCMGGYVRMVGTCTATKCPLHPFRFGTNPMHGRVGQKNPLAGKRLRKGASNKR